MNEKELFEILNNCSSGNGDSTLTEIKNILQIQNNELKSIRSMLTFFLILTIISLLVFVIVFSFINLSI